MYSHVFAIIISIIFITIFSDINRRREKEGLNIFKMLFNKCNVFYFIKEAALNEIKEYKNKVIKTCWYILHLGPGNGSRSGVQVRGRL